jgi:hypothetical protein
LRTSDFQKPEKRPFLQTDVLAQGLNNGIAGIFPSFCILSDLAGKMPKVGANSKNG